MMHQRAHVILCFFALGLSAAWAAPRTGAPLTEYKADPGSVEAFAIEVLTLAKEGKYDELKPYYHWTWNDFYGSFNPDYPWKTVGKAKELSDIVIRGAGKSEAHRDVHRLSYQVVSEDGRKRGASLMVVKDKDGYKLAVQANGSPVGNKYVKPGATRKAVDETFALVSTAPKEEKPNETIYTTSSGHVFTCTFDPQTSRLTGIQQDFGGKPVDLYLVIFDLEGSPTVKLKPAVTGG